MNTTSLFVAGLLLGVPLNGAKPLGEDISVRAEHIDVRNSGDRATSLTVGGPREKTWHFQTSHTLFRKKAHKEARGTYELIGRLAVFTGRDDEHGDIRLGLNHGRIREKVHFNAFFPDGDQFRYERAWYEKTADGWQPVQQLLITMPRAAFAKSELKWEVTVKAELSRWRRGQLLAVEKFEERLVFTHRQGQGYLLEQTTAPPWIPRTLNPFWNKNRVEGLGVDYGWNLQGFAPSLALRPSW